jgi:hypothetical protein
MIKKKLLYCKTNEFHYILYSKYSIAFYFKIFFGNSYINKFKNLNISINIKNSLHITSYFYIINLHLNLNTKVTNIKNTFNSKIHDKFNLIKSAFIYKNSQEHFIRNTYCFIFTFFYKNINLIFFNYLIEYFYKKKIKYNYNTFIYIQHTNKL